MNLSTENKIMDLENRGEEEGVVDWELGVNGCKLLPLEWISNDILLCSTGKKFFSKYERKVSDCIISKRKT